MHSIDLMRVSPVIRTSNGAREIDSRVQASVLRVLVLTEQGPVDSGVIARVGGATGEARNRVRALRGTLGELGAQNLIQTRHGVGYASDLTDWSVDAFRFREEIEESPAAVLATSVDSLFARGVATASQATRWVTQLQGTLSLWHQNPGEGIQPFAQRFERLHERGGLLLLLSRLRSGDESNLRQAVKELKLRLRSHSSNVQQWTWLVAACAALRDQRELERCRDDVAQAFGPSRPPQVEQLLARALAGDTLLPEVVEAPAATSTGFQDPPADLESFGELPAMVRTLGIETASQSKLLGSHLAPLEAIRRTESCLLFSGVLASKWVIEPAVRAEFEDLLTRLDVAGIHEAVRFQIIDPESASFTRLKKLRNGAVSTDSVPLLNRLAARHPSFSVRLFDMLPTFRILSIDDLVVTFSFYQLEAAKYRATDRGWNAPHVVLNPHAPIPLAEGFRQLFEETWRLGRPIREVS